MKFPFAATLAIAHRGAHAPGFPENSLAALHRAIALGAPAVEFDVTSLGDGVLVVSHDSSIEVAGARVDLSRSTSADVAGLIPPIDAHLETVAATDGLILNLDWKGSGGEGTVVDAVARHGLVDRTVISVSTPAALHAMKRRHRGVTAGLSVSDLAGGPAALADRLTGCGADAAMLSKRLATGETVAALRRLGVGVFLWTATDVPAFERLASLHPDGIATDVIGEQLAASHRADRRRGEADRGR